ncbi:Panacea domain-containing protein [Rhizobium mongolense]|uniref:Putative phage-associated protein n=1 Tax=Rhizobium mongolense TaxID=57676 RepID=A0A7W6WCJ0_9HYPH|nr:type II toxin-antitoxin system antitoxin SocA domain-containing protein [Rhizobium mongolense]MBB4272810.1 putative phage-associated protein [Rhizobium mongolense]
MHDSRVVANRFLELARNKGDSLTPMQLLKLVYIAHGWMLGLYGRPLIRDKVEAWQYGPVIPKLYNHVRNFRSQPVVGPISAPNESLAPHEGSIVKQVYDIYGSMTGPALSRLTHASRTPWDLTFMPDEYGIEISNDIIEDHYRRLAEKTGSTPD